MYPSKSKLLLLLLFLFSNLFSKPNLEKIAISKLANALINQEYDLVAKIDQLDRLPEYLINPLKEELIRQSTELFEPKLCRKLIGHEAAISHVALSANCEFALTAAEDNSAVIWDLQDLNIGVKKILPDAATALALSPDGRYAFISCENKTAELWDLSTKNPIKGWHVEKNSSVAAAAFSADNKYLLTGGLQRYQARLRDITKYPFESFVLGGHRDSICAVAFNADGKFAATGVSSYGTVKIWSLADDSKKGIDELKGMHGVHSIAFNRDGQYILTGSYDYIRLWNLTKDPIECKYLDAHKLLANIVAMSFIANDKYAISAANNYNDNTIRLWDLTLAQPACIKVIELENYGPTVFSAQGKYALIGSSDGIARLWSLEIFSLLPALNIEELILVIKLQQLKLAGKSYHDLLDMPELRQILENSKYKNNTESYFEILLS